MSWRCRRTDWCVPDRLRPDYLSTLYRQISTGAIYIDNYAKFIDKMRARRETALTLHNLRQRLHRRAPHLRNRVPQRAS